MKKIPDYIIKAIVYLLMLIGVIAAIWFIGKGGLFELK
jgi:hypothetical protein